MPGSTMSERPAANPKPSFDTALPCARLPMLCAGLRLPEVHPPRRVAGPRTHGDRRSPSLLAPCRRARRLYSPVRQCRVRGLPPVDVTNAHKAGRLEPSPIRAVRLAVLVERHVPQRGIATTTSRNLFGVANGRKVETRYITQDCVSVKIPQLQ
jgi:hypothetical protein